jgi:hypothetical protein
VIVLAPNSGDAVGEPVGDSEQPLDDDDDDDDDDEDEDDDDDDDEDAEAEREDLGDRSGVSDGKLVAMLVNGEQLGSECSGNDRGGRLGRECGVESLVTCELLAKNVGLVVVVVVGDGDGDGANVLVTETCCFEPLYRR